MLSFEQLIGEHEAIGAAAKSFERILASPKPNVIAALAARARLSALLKEHLAHEDAQVYPRLIAVAHGPTADIARRFATQYESMVADWLAYMNRWTGDAMAADWRRFRNETAVVFTVLRERIEAENAILYPTALAATALTLRRQVA
ncbi:MAG: hemerythrin domain-containing protein [Pseudomonadota bacterium]